MKKVFILLAALTLVACSGQTSTITSSISSSISSNSSSQSSSVYNEYGDTDPNLDGYLSYDEAFNDGEIDSENSYKDGEFNSPYISNKSNPSLTEVRFTSLNDVHGALYFSDGDGNGFDNTAYFLNEYQKNGDSINILVGDIFQGQYLSNMTHGKAFVDVINQMDFDCFVIGNHEFDWGLDVLEGYKDGDLTNGELNIPFLGANIYYKGTDSHPDFIDPYMIVNYGDVKVGVIGMIGDSIENSIDANRVGNYEFKNCQQLTREYSKILHQDYDCDYVVLAIHDYDEEDFSYFASFNGDEKIDFIFGGHTHYVKNDRFVRSDGSYLYALQGGANNERIVTAEIDIATNIASYKIDYYSSNRDSEIQNYLLTNFGDFISQANEVVATLDRRKNEYEIGTETVEYYMNYYDVQAAFINTAGVRDSLPSGEITNNDLLKVYPFDNLLYDVVMSGRDLYYLLRNQQDYIYSASRGNIDISYDVYYHVITINYVYTGSYYRSYLKDSHFKNLNITLRESYLSCLQG